MDEPRLAGIVRPAVDRDVEARHAELLAPLAVEHDELIDRRAALQGLDVVGTALIERGDARAGDPADLTLDLFQELIDPVRGRLGLLGFRIGHRDRGFAVHRPGLERHVDGEHEHHEPDEGHDVLGEQSAPSQPIPSGVLHPSLGSPAKKFAQEIAGRTGEARAVLRSRRRRDRGCRGDRSWNCPSSCSSDRSSATACCRDLASACRRHCRCCCCRRRTASRPCRTGPAPAHGAWHRRRRDRTGFRRRRDRCADRSSFLRC